MLTAEVVSQIAETLNTQLERFELNWHDYNVIVNMQTAPRLSGLPLTLPLKFGGYSMQDWAAVKLDCNVDKFLTEYGRYVLAVHKDIECVPHNHFSNWLGIKPSEASYLFNFVTRRRAANSVDNRTLAGLACAGLALWNYPGARVIEDSSTSFVVSVCGHLVGVSGRALVHPSSPVECPPSGLIPRSTLMKTAWSGICRQPHPKLADKAFKHFKRRTPRLSNLEQFDYTWRILRHRGNDTQVRRLLADLCFDGKTEREARYAVKG